MGEPFYLNRAHANFIPQQTKLNSPTLHRWQDKFWHSAWIWYLLVVSPCAIMSVWYTLGMYFQEQLFYRNYGVPITAAIVDCEREVPRGKGNIQLHLTFRYVINATELIGTETIVDTPLLCENIPTELSVEYLSYSPANVRITDNRVTNNHNLFATMALFFGVGFWILPIAGFGQEMIPKYIFEKWQVPLLERKGIILDGEIINSTDGYKKTRYGKEYLVTITYQFTVRKWTKQGVFSNVRHDLRRDLLPTAGTPIKVLYVSSFCHIPL